MMDVDLSYGDGHSKGNIPFVKRYPVMKSKNRFPYFLFALFALLPLLPGAEPYSLPVKTPEELNFDPRLTEWIDGIASEMISEDETSGVVIAVGRQSGLAYLKAFGNRQVEPEVLPMSLIMR